MLVKLVLAGKLDPLNLITHGTLPPSSYLPKLIKLNLEFAFGDMETAYSTFGAASKHKALKVLIKF